MTLAWSSILSHPAVNTWNPYRKIESFAELYEHKCQKSCYPCEDWNGQKWCNQTWPIRLILHLPVLHAFYSLNKGQLKILDIQASKPDNPTLLYSCRKCLLDNNCFQSSLQKQGWPHRAALPHSGDSPHVRGLGALCFADIYAYASTWTLPHGHTSTIPGCCSSWSRASRAAGGSAEARGQQRERKYAHQLCSSHPVPHTAQLALHTDSQHGQLPQRKPRKKQKKPPLLVAVKWVRTKAKTQRESIVTLGIMQSILQISEHNIKKWVKEWSETCQCL